MAENEQEAAAGGEDSRQVDALKIERGAMGSLKLGDEEFFPLSIEHRRAIIRSLARDDERLTKRRKDLEAEGLRAGVAEVDEHIALNGFIKRRLAIQIDAFEQTPIGRAMAEGESKHEASPPLAGEDEITMPDGSRLPIDSIIGSGDNPDEFVVASGGGPVTIWHARDEGQWRVVKLALEYPPAKRDVESAAAELQAAAAAGTIDDGAPQGEIKDGKVSLTAIRNESAAEKRNRLRRERRAAARGGQPEQIGSAVAKTVAKATGERKIPVPRKRKK